MPNYRFPAEESATAPPNATTLGQQVYGTLREEILSGAMKPGCRLDPDAVRQRIDAGYRFIACGLDTMFIMQGCRQMLAVRGTAGEEKSA